MVESNQGHPNHNDVTKWKHFPRYWPFMRVGEFPSQRPVTWSFDIFFDLRLKKRLSQQSWGWWFETPSRSLWRHCNHWNNLHSNDDPQHPIFLTFVPCIISDLSWKFRQDALTQFLSVMLLTDKQTLMIINKSYIYMQSCASIQSIEI